MILRNKTSLVINRLHLSCTYAIDAPKPSIFPIRGLPSRRRAQEGIFHELLRQRQPLSRFRRTHALEYLPDDRRKLGRDGDAGRD